MRKLSESVWGDIRKKSLGQEDRIEDNIDLMTIDEFSNYVDKHYVGTTNHIKMKSGRAGQEEQFFDILVLIKTVHFKSGGTSTAFIRLQYFFNKVHNEIYVCITNKSVVKETPTGKGTLVGTLLYDKLEERYKINDEPGVSDLMIAPSDGTKCTNRFFLDVLDFLIENEDQLFKAVAKKNDDMNESVWGDIRKKSLGQEERQEFAFNPDYIDFGDKTTVYWTSNCFSYENRVKFYYDNIEGYENNGWRLPTMAEVGQLDWENCQIYMSGGKTYVKLNGGEFIFNDAGLSHINMWMQEGGYNNNAYGYNNSQGTHEFSIKRFNSNYTALYVLLVKDKPKKK